MSTVAFLSSVVDPRIASAAAKSAMDEFCKIKDQVPTSILDSHLKIVAQHATETGKRDPNFGLSQSGIAGTAPVEKEALAIKDKEKSDESTEDGKLKEIKNEEEKGKGEKGDEAVVKMETDEEEKSKEKKEGEAHPEGDSSEKEKGESSKEAEAEEEARPETEEEKLAKDSTLQAAAAASLSAAAVKAKHLAAVEERKIKSLVALLVETQMKVPTI